MIMKVQVSVDREIRRSYKDDNREVDMVFQDTLYKKFQSILPTVTSKIKTEVCPLPFNVFDTLSESGYERFTVKLGEDSVEYTFRVPRIEVLTTMGYEPDIALFLNRVSISKRTVHSGGYWAENAEKSCAFAYNGINDITYNYKPPVIHQPRYHSGGSKTFIETGLHYVLWDYKANKMVACGVLTSSVTVFVAARKRTLKSLYGVALRNIISNSPFASSSGTNKR